MNPMNEDDLAGIPDGPMCWGCEYLDTIKDPHGRIVQTSCQALPASKAHARAGHESHPKHNGCPKPRNQGEWP